MYWLRSAGINFGRLSPATLLSSSLPLPTSQICVSWHGLGEPPASIQCCMISAKVVFDGKYTEFVASPR